MGHLQPLAGQKSPLCASLFYFLKGKKSESSCVYKGLLPLPTIPCGNSSRIRCRRFLIVQSSGLTGWFNRRDFDSRELRRTISQLRLKSIFPWSGLPLQFVKELRKSFIRSLHANKHTVADISQKASSQIATHPKDQPARSFC